jgi:hypothetical protein
MPLSQSSGLLRSPANKCSGAGIGSVPDSDKVTAGPVIFSPDGSVVVDLRLTPCVVLMWYPQNMLEWKRPRHTPETVLGMSGSRSHATTTSGVGAASPFVGYRRISVGCGRISEREMHVPIGAGSDQRVARRCTSGNGPLQVSRLSERHHGAID